MAKDTKPKANFGKPIQVHDGEAHRYLLRKDGRNISYTVCCDCGLTHLEEYTPRKGYIRVRVWRDDDRTAEMRRRKEYAKKLKRS